MKKNASRNGARAPRGVKVFVGMSGGVDSSVSAALLQKAGYDVTGVFIKVWQPEWLPCAWKEERRDALRVAAHLHIPFLTFDFRAKYKKAVADYMIREYELGRTPNPDVMCNKEIKFGSFLRKARDMGADFIATGHYAEVAADAKKPDQFHFFEGADKTKDQSYFLWTLTQNELAHVLFPVGHLLKTQVRALAKKFKLPTAEKKDSQGICFIGDIEMREFLSHYIPEQPGKVLNENDETIGTHAGVVFYTIGERHGFTITKKTPTDKPYYIISKNVKANTLVVSQKYAEDDLKTVKKIKLTDVNWISVRAPEWSQKNGQKLQARFRYRQEKQTCRLIDEAVSPKTKKNTKKHRSEIDIEFSAPQQAVAVGQSLVLYDGVELVGGGIVADDRVL